jgi:hypothetical protein
VQILFDSLADPGANPNYWGQGLNVDGVTDPDASWSIFGGAGSKTTAISDRDLTTGLETVDDPDTLDPITYQDTTDILATWNPTNILHVVATAIGAGDVLNNATLTLDDGTGVVGSTAEVVTATPRIVTVHAPLNSGGTAWTVAELNAANTDYDVSS